MPASPICEVREGLGPWTPTTDGVNVTPGATISIRLADTTDASEWYLRIFGTDELTPIPPTLSNVNPLTNKVTTPSTMVTFMAPATTGHALAFESTIVTPLQTLQTTFGIFELADNGLRVGSVGETREGSVAYGWAKMINEAVRSIGSGFTAGGDLSGTSTDQTVVGIQGRAVVDTAPADGEVYKWNETNNQFEPGPGGGGGGTLAGDVTGPSDANEVTAILGMPSPDPAHAAENLFFKVRDTRVNPFTTPRSVVSDGTYLYVAESAQDNPGTGIIWKVQPVGTTLTIVGSVNLALTVPEVDFVRDIAQDDTYIYAACWVYGHIAVIDKASMTVVGWGYAGDAGGSKPIVNRATSVCADNAGNFYVAVAGIKSSFDPGIQKFATASCLGQVPKAVLASATYTADRGPRKVRYGGGKLWMTRGGYNLSRIDPATMTLEENYLSYVPETDSMSALYAFGSVWVSFTNGVVARVDPTDLTSFVTIDSASGTDLDELIVGPAANGTADARVFMTYPRGQWVGVIDPNTNTWETTLNPSGISTNTLDGMGVVSGRLWSASFKSFSNPGEYDLWWIYPSGGIYTDGGVVADLELFYGVAFTAGGDLTGTATNQQVRSLHGVLVPDASGAADGAAVTLSVTLRASSPRRMAVDPVNGTLWIVDNTTPWLFHVDQTTGELLSAYNIGNDNSNVTRCRDVVVDLLYVYVTTWDYGRVVKINKGGMYIQGYAYVQSFAMFLALDGAGGLYVTVGTGTGDPNGLQKFDTATMDWQNPFTYTYDAICVLPTAVRQVVYGGGYLWVGCGSNANVVYKIDPTTMTVSVTSADTGSKTVDMVHGLGGLWVTTDNDNVVLQLDETTLNVLNTVSLPDRTMGVCIGPDQTGTPSTWIWVTSNLSSYLWGIDPNTATLAVTLVGENANDQYDGIVQSGTRLWVAMQSGDNVSVGVRQFDPAAQTEPLSVPLNVFQLVFTGASGLTGYTESALYRNTALGVGTRPQISGYYDNTMLGYNAGAQVFYSQRNTFVGSQAGYWAYSNTDTTLVGFNTALTNGGGSYSSIFGSYAGYSSYGNYSSFFGYYAGYQAYGANNTAFGAYAGNQITSGHDNTLLGYSANPSAFTSNYEIVIGSNLSGKGGGHIVIGSTTTAVEAWLRGNVLHVGNEGAVDKYLRFQNSASTNQPGLKWNNATSKLQWSHDGSTYTDFSAGGATGPTVTLGANVSSGALLMLDLDRTGTTYNELAYPVPTSSVGQPQINAYTIRAAMAGWRTGTALTGRYQYDACAVRSNVVMIAWAEGLELRVRFIVFTFTPASNQWTIDYTAVAYTTIYTATNPITDISVAAPIGGRYGPPDQAVVAFVENGHVKLIGVTYQSPPTTPPTYGSVVDPGYTDVTATALCVEKNYSNTTTGYMRLAVGRSGTGTGTVGQVTVTASNTVNLSFPTNYYSFGNNSGGPDPSAIHLFGLDGVNNAQYWMYGIMYGATRKGLATFSSNSSAGMDWMPMNTNSYSTGLTNTAWTIDGDYLNAATEPGFGDLVGDTWVSIFHANAVATSKTIISSGPWSFMPVLDRAQPLPPVDGSAPSTYGWGLTMVTVKAITDKTFVWIGRDTSPWSWAGGGTTGQQLLMGTGRVDNGRVSISPGVAITNGYSGYSIFNYSLPYYYSATAKYIKTPIVPLGNNRFCVVFSSFSWDSFSETRINGVALYTGDERECAFAIAQAAGSAGASISIAVNGGISTAWSSLVAGRRYYMNETGYNTEPSRYPIGTALSATSLLIDGLARNDRRF